MTEIFQDGSNGQILFVPEVTRGTTPASPTMKVMRFVSDSLASNTNAIQSNEIRPGRAVSDLVSGADEINGDISIELSVGNFDEFLESATGNAFSTPINFSGSATFSGAGITATGAFTNAVAGQYIKVVSDLNAGVYKIQSVTNSNTVVIAHKLGVDSWSAFAAETDASTTIKGKYVKNGSTRKSFTLEKGFPEAQTYEVYRGLEVASFDFNAEPSSVITMTINTLAKAMAVGSSTIAVSATPANSNPVLNSINSFKTIRIGSNEYQDSIIGITFSVNNNTRNTSQIGTKENIVGFGQQVITGELKTLLGLNNIVAALNAQKVAETYSDLVMHFEDSLGNGIIFNFPQIKISTSTTPNEGNNTDVTATFGWGARDAGNGLQFAISTY